MKAKAKKATEIKQIHYAQMELIFRRLKLKTLENWKYTSNNRVKRFGGKHLLKKYGNFHTLLNTFYPNYPWNWGSVSYELLSTQHEILDELYNKFNLKKVTDWLKLSTARRKKFRINEMLQHYGGSMAKMLECVYPNYPWNAPKSSGSPFPKVALNSKEKQRYRMDQLYKEFKFTSLEDWQNYSLNSINLNGGGHLLRKHDYNLHKLLEEMYPYYPWEFKASPRKKIKRKETQREFMDRIYRQFKFQSLEDWLLINRSKLRNNGGGQLLAIYDFDMKKLLSSIYPNYPWNFDYRHFLQLKLKELKNQYHVTRKKDWYRVQYDASRKYEIYYLLRTCYPTENWQISYFKTRVKRATQRLLYCYICKLFPSTPVFEGYFHPKLTFSCGNYELDVFIPAYHLAIEYQGQQHYDDIPSGFSGVDNNQFRDEVKETLASTLNIKIIYIPYWDSSFHSVHSFFSSFH